VDLLSSIDDLAKDCVKEGYNITDYFADATPTGFYPSPMELSKPTPPYVSSTAIVNLNLWSLPLAGAIMLTVFGQ
jgi:hypothetical protein